MDIICVSLHPTPSLSCNLCSTKNGGTNVGSILYGEGVGVPLSPAQLWARPVYIKIKPFICSAVSEFSETHRVLLTQTLQNEQRHHSRQHHYVHKLFEFHVLTPFSLNLLLATFIKKIKYSRLLSLIVHRSIVMLSKLHRCVIFLYCHTASKIYQNQQKLKLIYLAYILFGLSQ